MARSEVGHELFNMKMHLFFFKMFWFGTKNIIFNGAVCHLSTTPRHVLPEYRTNTVVTNTQMPILGHLT